MYSINSNLYKNFDVEPQVSFIDTPIYALSPKLVGLVLHHLNCLG